VSTKVTRGVSERMTVLGRISCKAKTPKPLPSDWLTSIRVPTVSGHRRGFSRMGKGCGVEGMAGEMSLRP